MNNRKALLYQFEHRLEICISELGLFENDNIVFHKISGFTNSAGNLVLHINGNLRYFIGNILGNSGYIRNREYEFAATFVSREELKDQCVETISELRETFHTLDEDDLDKIYPAKLDFLPGTWTSREFLTHLIAHQAYHLGQINTLRRILNP